MAERVLQGLDHHGEAQQAQRTEEREQDDRQLPQVPEEPFATRLGEPQPREVVNDEYTVNSDQRVLDGFGGAASQLG